MKRNRVFAQTLLVSLALPQSVLALEFPNPFAAYERTIAASYDWSNGINPDVITVRALQIAKNQQKRAFASADTAMIGSVIVGPNARVAGPITVNVQISEPVTILGRAGGTP